MRPGSKEVHPDTAANAVDYPKGTDREPSPARIAFECMGTMESI
jgi:hypothetical protein